MICTASLSGLINDVQTAQTEPVLPPLRLRLSTPRWSERTAGAGCNWLRCTAAVLMHPCCVSARINQFNPHFRPIVNTTQDAAQWPGEPSICPSACCWLVVDAGNKEWERAAGDWHNNHSVFSIRIRLQHGDLHLSGRLYYSASPAGWTEFSRTMNKSPTLRSPQLLLGSRSAWEKCWENHVLLWFSLAMQKEELHVLETW